MWFTVELAIGMGCRSVPCLAVSFLALVPCSLVFCKTVAAPASEKRETHARTPVRPHIQSHVLCPACLACLEAKETFDVGFVCYGLCQEACASWIGTPEQTTSVSRCVGVRERECVCVCEFVWCLAALELQPSVPVPRYCTALPAGLGRRYQHHTAAEQEHFGGESDPGPWISPLSGTTARLLAWVQHCVRLAATITPPVLGPCCEENADGDLLSNPSPCLRPTSYTYTLLSPCMQISASLSSSPPLPPLAIRHSFILPLSRTSPSKPPSPFLDSVQKRREGEYYPLGCIDIRTQLPL